MYASSADASRWQEDFEHAVLLTLDEKAPALPQWALRAWPGLHWCPDKGGALALPHGPHAPGRCQCMRAQSAG